MFSRMTFVSLFWRSDEVWRSIDLLNSWLLRCGYRDRSTHTLALLISNKGRYSAHIFICFFSFEFLTLLHPFCFFSRTRRELRSRSWSSNKEKFGLLCLFQSFFWWFSSLVVISLLCFLIVHFLQTRREFKSRYWGRYDLHFSFFQLLFAGDGDGMGNTLPFLLSEWWLGVGKLGWY